LLFGFGFSFALAAEAQVMSDRGEVTVGGTTYRLWGIIPPDPQRRCRDGWDAAAAASRQLETLVNGRSVDCEFRGHDSEGRSLALCRADGQDLGAELVRNGLAWASVEQTHQYVLDEGQAMSRMFGVHAHGCHLPQPSGLAGTGPH
jgi:endonuclease YncB( thermonuclease family)